VNEIEESEKLFFKWAQTEQDPSKIDKKLLAKIDDEGILRALGRLEKIRTLKALQESSSHLYPLG
jgi:hypothetical protein